MQTIILITVEEQTSYLQMTEGDKPKETCILAIQWIKDCFVHSHFHFHTAEINAFVSKYLDDLRFSKTVLGIPFNKM